MAAAAGVPYADVVVSAVRSSDTGGTTVSSDVHFPQTATSTSSAFSSTLSNSPSSVFVSFSAAYGSITAADVSVITILRVYSPPSQPPLHSPPVPSPPPPSPPPPTISLSARSGTAGNAIIMLYRQATAALTCLRTVELPPDVTQLHVDATSGPTTLSWRLSQATLCTTSGCTLDLCGFSVGLYTVNGTMEFDPASTLPTYRVSSTVHDFHAPHPHLDPRLHL
ncbi:hypothetical protein CYMTET_28997 [Cymbomonas tetramitiformis]|uniref:Uncharacterized protein n=1 Tax=Cymbomonas tetramitiformis TaxID=36881 RepID=A0AAE0KVN1_9CHLO|nr:hypothetical protein CYMTET_28997 [Cymbomonas tetramitiformis]